MSVKNITRTALIAASAVALGASLGLVTPASAQPMETVVSDSWQPGFVNDGGGKYIRLVPAEAAGATTSVLRVEQSNSWRPGFTMKDDSGYIRLVKDEVATQNVPQIAEVYDTWRPGTLKDEDRYIRLLDAE